MRVVHPVAAARGRARLDGLLAARLATPSLLLLLVAISLLLRTRIIGTGFWIDEGLSVGISSHPFTQIPHVLRQDGSPPLYYLLLAGWMRLFGDTETATHALSLLLALACIPLAYWAASPFGRRSAWICTALATVNPFLTAYAQETRMYTLVVLLSLVGARALVEAFIRRRRVYLPLLALVLVAMLYSHNWGAFYAVGVTAAVAVHAFVLRPEERRPLVRDGLLVAVAVVAAFAPWIPTLLFQARHTGAPWSTAPNVGALLDAPATILSSEGVAMTLLLAGGTGLAVLLRRRAEWERSAVWALGTLVAATIASAWLVALLSSAWTGRYLAVVLGPLLVLAAAGLARAGRLGIVGLAFVLVFWITDTASPDKSNVREITAQVAPELHRGDLILSTHPEQVPVLHYYLPDGLRYATTLGPVRDANVMDWRDAVDRLERARPKRTLDRLLRAQPTGSKIVVVNPVFRDYRGWRAPWTALVYQRSTEWNALLQKDPRVHKERTVVLDEITMQKKFFKPVEADVYVKVHG